VLAGQMVVDDSIGKWDQQTIAAIAAFDTRLLADTSAPFVNVKDTSAQTSRGLT